MGPAKSGRHHPTHQIKLPKLRVRSRSGLLNLEQRSARLLIIPTATQNHSNPHGDTESQQPARRRRTTAIRTILIRKNKNTQQAGYGSSAAAAVGRCTAAPAPIHLVQGGIRPVVRAAGPDLHQASPRRRGGLRSLDIFPRIGNIAAWQARRPLLPPPSPLAAWWVVVWWRPERGEGGLL